MSVLNAFKFATLLGGMAVWSVACGAGSEGADESLDQVQPSDARGGESQASDSENNVSATSAAKADSTEADAPELMLVGAGPESAKLGVNRWEFSGDSIRGLSAEDDVLAEFVVHEGESVIESLVPSAGQLGLDETNAVDTFTAEVRQFFDAMQADQEQVPSDSAGNASVQPSVFLLCTGSFFDCNSAAAVVISTRPGTRCTCTSSQRFPCGVPGVPSVRLDCF
ncbi:MAG TPA: hypothetical protein VNN80_14050 [Polyangiaceae bacterium]|nr:hypothetical protein [Polyangiaceae bacterium]